MIETSATINNEKGIHVRPSGLIFKEIFGYPGEIIVTKDGVATHIQDIISILTLGLTKSQIIGLSVNGPDEENKLNNLKVLFEKNYEFEEL